MGDEVQALPREMATDEAVGPSAVHRSSLRRRVYEVLEGSRVDNPAGRVVDGALIVLVIISVTAAVLETVASTVARYESLLVDAEAACGIIFTIETLLRIWVSPEDRRNRFTHPIGGRLRYMLTPIGLIDIVSALPFWLAVLTPLSVGDLWLFRVVRVLKMLRFTGAIEIFATVLRNERKPLLSGLTIGGVLLVVLSSVMYLVEKDVQPDKFGSVPDAMWWGIVTLATVGYGDAVPVTPLGRLIGSFTVIMGLGLFALPAGVIASGFIEESRRRSFVVTWNLVASVPFFENLPATRIAEIANGLVPQVAVKGETIVEQGEPADCMYFIASGEVSVLVEPRPVRLHSGDFFGEIALLTDMPRTATVVAASTTQLLVLRVSDFQKLLEAHDDLRATISKVAEARLASRVPAPVE
jgi:voltage-gated potassium channel